MKNQQNLLGECHAELKLSGIMDGFKKKYMVLTHEKLYFFSNSQRIRVTNVVCFRAYQVKVQLLKNVIQLTLCQFNNKKWEIKFDNQELAENWCISIKEIIKKCYLYDGFGILKQFNKTYYNEDILTEIEFKRFCETGDVLLFETDNIGAVLQRKVTRSKYDHVGIVVRFSENDVRVFDANCDTGVTLMQWEQFIDENDLYTKVAIRRLIYSKKSEDAQPMLMNLMGETLGKKYGISVSKLLNVHKQYMTSQQNQQFIENFEKLDPKEKLKIQKMAQETALNTNKEEYFCSEITAIYYKRLGIMSPTIPPCQYWPVSFTQNRNLQLLKGAKFGNEISILLNRHRDPFNVSFE
ncbi:hypothetical protein PPERSA_09236 [Pseudocohnilembus persalinus]|uniref:PH domain-containing protein n=1 Tax=Pseudocohnilembus persalinus TaxID=266149 RepID=A0A0V0QME3_PSEPJ|nr:hypothetical protein PPERSA_09236 [Pseudocohnilembus persalinus]|eukprot:KRX03224.1 hypothetical protein PPERSA_09236 [Pseudocohnilembus persalinus]